MQYHDGTDVRAGDHILHHDTEAVVETIIDGDEIAEWGLDSPGFMIICGQCGRVLIEPGSCDWEDVDFVCRGEVLRASSTERDCDLILFRPGP